MDKYEMDFFDLEMHKNVSWRFLEMCVMELFSFYYKTFTILENVQCNLY